MVLRLTLGAFCGDFVTPFVGDLLCDALDILSLADVASVFFFVGCALAEVDLACSLAALDAGSAFPVAFVVGLGTALAFFGADVDCFGMVLLAVWSGLALGVGLLLAVCGAESYSE